MAVEITQDDIAGKLVSHPMVFHFTHRWTCRGTPRQFAGEPACC